MPGWKRIVLVGLSLALSNCSSTSAPKSEPPAASSLTYHGISFSHEVRTHGYGSKSAGREIEKIREIGADSIALVPYAFTRAPEDTVIRTHTDETDERVIASIEQARSAGLRVMLKPHLWARRFTGDIRFESDRAFDTWFAQYREWLLHYAEMARVHDVELLAIGNELGGLTGREQAWRDLIRDVRAIYGGKVTYASHWYQEFERVAFWDVLDFIGVNAYFPLAGEGEMPRTDSPRVDEIASQLEAISQRFGKPVLFTEVGYASISKAAVEPWADREGSSDVAMQAHCYEVMLEGFSRRSWLAGMFWWKWPSDGREDPGDLSHRPNGKPALDVLRRWFQGRDASAATIRNNTQSANAVPSY